MSKEVNGRKDLKRFFSLAIILVLFFLSFKILQPFLILLVSSFILAYMVRPLYKKLNKKLSKAFSATLCILLILLIILIPLSVVIGGVISQANESLENTAVESFLTKLSSGPFGERFNIDVNSLFDQAALFFASLLGDILSYLPSLVISLLILIFGVYYILVDWESLSKNLKRYIPFKQKEKVAKELDKGTRAIIYGSFLIALVQFFISIIGFYFSGVTFYFLIPSLVFVLAFFPGIGPTLVWVPLLIYYLFTSQWYTAVGVLITGLVLSIYADTILRSSLLGKKANINSFIMLVGIIGGIILFGAFGFVLGPLILVYTIRLLKELVE